MKGTFHPEVKKLDDKKKTFLGRKETGTNLIPLQNYFTSVRKPVITKSVTSAIKMIKTRVPLNTFD